MAGLNLGHGVRVVKNIFKRTRTRIVRRWVCGLFHPCFRIYRGHAAGLSLGLRRRRFDHGVGILVLFLGGFQNYRGPSIRVPF